LTLTRLFIGYYRNLTQAQSDDVYFQTYNMGLAVFLTISALFLVTGILIIRKYFIIILTRKQSFVVLWYLDMVME